MMTRRVILATATATTLLLAGCSSSDDDAAQDPMSVVEAAYASFNDGDVDTWVEIRDRGSAYASEEERATELEEWRTEIDRRVQDGWQYVDIECQSQGEGEWPVADEGDVSGVYVTCDTSLVDGDGTTQYAEAFEWVVHDRDVVAVRSDD